MLGGDASVEMMQASTWADEIRPKRPNTAPWHFVDIPIQSNGYDAGRDCPATTASSPKSIVTLASWRTGSSPPQFAQKPSAS